MSLKDVLSSVPPGWHVVAAWSERTANHTRERVAQSAAAALRDLQMVRDDPLRLVIDEVVVRAFNTRIPVWAVAVIARDDAPPVDFPEPAS